VSNPKVEKVLLKGSIKQRINLLSDHVGDTSMSGKGFLTESEVSALVASFKTEKELETYRKYRRFFDIVRGNLTNLAQARLGYMVTLGKLEKLILTRVANEDFEDAINLVLNAITDKKTKKALSQKIQRDFMSIPLLRFFDLDDEDYLQVKNQEHLSEEMINGLKKTLKKEQTKIKTHLRAIKDFIDEIGLKVRVFEGYLKSTENWLKSDKGKEATWLLSRQEGIKNYALEEDIKNIEIDEKLYDYYKRDLYGD
jgi:hypothetical protein